MVEVQRPEGRKVAEIDLSPTISDRVDVLEVPGAEELGGCLGIRQGKRNVGQFFESSEVLRPSCIRNATKKKSPDTLKQVW